MGYLGRTFLRDLVGEAAHCAARRDRWLEGEGTAPARRSRPRRGTRSTTMCLAPPPYHGPTTATSSGAASPLPRSGRWRAPSLSSRRAWLPIATCPTTGPTSSGWSTPTGPGGSRRIRGYLRGAPHQPRRGLDAGGGLLSTAGVRRAGPLLRPGAGRNGVLFLRAAKREVSAEGTACAEGKETPSGESSEGPEERAMEKAPIATEG